MDSTRTISELKSAFIWSQVRIFSESLDLPEDWRNYAAETTEGDLSDKVIEDVLHKVNAAAKQHNRVVYSSQAIHHVAQQIANLYWSSVSQEARSQDAFARGIEKTTDLSREMNITKMPVNLESEEASEEDHASRTDTGSSVSGSRVWTVNGSNGNGALISCIIFDNY
ncbi:hypothetical protein LT330_003496 [Penicillium expansum]|nr:hypothetical protein LT330_003496 [Penicillium expansum]